MKSFEELIAHKEPFPVEAIEGYEKAILGTIEERLDEVFPFEYKNPTTKLVRNFGVVLEAEEGQSVQISLMFAQGLSGYSDEYGLAGYRVCISEAHDMYYPGDDREDTETEYSAEDYDEDDAGLMSSELDFFVSLDGEITIVSTKFITEDSFDSFNGYARQSIMTKEELKEMLEEQMIDEDEYEEYIDSGMLLKTESATA
jgi:hypothetical protein